MAVKRVVYKYLIPGLPGVVRIQMPIGAELLSFQVQDGQLQLWALVAPANRTNGREFRLAWTGEEWLMTSPVRFIGTAQDGGLVYHLFEVLWES